MNEKSTTVHDSPALVVGIGASAGGLTPCKKLLASAPADRGIAFVVVMHLDPSQQSHIAEILGKATRMEVTQIAGGERVEPNHVYVIAPATSLGIHEGVLHAGEPEQPHYRAKPIDAFFSSLAADLGKRTAGIVLSGTGNNGSAGLQEIHAAGGLCLAQDPATAEYDSMPRSAIDTGVVEALAAPEAMGKILLAYAEAPHARPAPAEHEQPAIDEPRSGLDGILALLGKQYGIDFRDYKRGTLQRRTARRMNLRQLSDWNGYLDYLRAHPAEGAALYDDVLINVTRFFRDPKSWEHLERDVVPALLEKHDRDTPVRVWSAGCATGEEAYSLAMVFLEQIEKRRSRCSLQVFASDVSHEALTFGGRGRYPASIEGDVGPERLRRFFHRTGKHFQVDRLLRDSVTFAPHNLLRDPPFANLDLVSCRNVLIYLEPHAQERLFQLFHFSLRPKGVLWLGSSETMGQRSKLFEQISNEHRMYRSVGLARADRYHVPPWIGAKPSSQWPSVERGATRSKVPNVARVLEQFVLQRYTLPAVAVDRSFEILHFFGATDDYLRQPPGEARMDLLSWVRPGLYAKLRAGLLDAVEHSKTVTICDMRLERAAETARIEVTIEPVASPDLDGVFVISFRDIPKPPGPAVAPVKKGVADDSLVRQLEQELQDTRQELQGTVEQLEIANEEHRASHEEMLSLNEELQSSNEELETSKEELQSLNEELTTINRQLEERNDELRFLTGDLNNLLVSAGVPTLFLDRQLRVRRFTPACTELMRIVETDVGRSLEHIKLEVHDENLCADIERVLEKLVPIEAEVPADGDRWFVRIVRPYRTEEERIDGVCITFHDVSAQKQATAESEEARRFAEAIVQSSRTPLLVLDAELRVVRASRAFLETFHVSADEILGQKLYHIGNRQWDIPSLRGLLEQVLPKTKDIRNYDMEHVFESIGWRAMRLNAAVMERHSQANLILVSIEDVTDLRRAEAAAQRQADALTEDHRRKDEFLALLGHELRNPLAALKNGIDLISMTSTLPEPVAQVGDMMARQIRRMTTMLDQLLEVGRVISGKLELARDAVDVAGAVRAAIETATPMIESAQQELTVSLPPEGTVLVLGDGVRLAQVVENLLANAAKYTERDGRIWVTASATEDTVELSVRDTGVGMEPEVLAHAFDLFTQGPRSLDRAKGGLGLGLALVRSLVEMHGGHVEARSAGPGKGSELVVALPRLRPGRVKQAREAYLRPAPSRRILVVEDEEDAGTMLTGILRVHGHEVRLVDDGPAALQAAREFRPDAVLLDLGLPGMDGYEVARALRHERGERMLMVAMTGYQKDAERLAETGFDGYLLKPLDLQKLLDLLAGSDARDEEEGGS